MTEKKDWLVALQIRKQTDSSPPRFSLIDSAVVSHNFSSYFLNRCILYQFISAVGASYIAYLKRQLRPSYSAKWTYIHKTGLMKQFFFQNSFKHKNELTLYLAKQALQTFFY